MLAVATAACGGNSTAPTPVEQLDGTWALLAFENPDGTAEAIANPDRYTATFGADGRLGLRADCNVCSGPYTTSGSALSVGGMACTRVACPAGSRSDDFIQAMSDASSFLRDEETLLIDHAAGRMRFGRN